MTDDPVMTLRVTTPAGRLTLMAEPVMDGPVMVARRTHVQDASANHIGAANLMVLARALMKEMDLHELVVEGAVRTTGPNPGHRPRAVRFTRHARAAAVS